MCSLKTTKTCLIVFGLLGNLSFSFSEWSSVPIIAPYHFRAIVQQCAAQTWTQFPALEGISGHLKNRVLASNRIKKVKSGNGFSPHEGLFQRMSSPNHLLPPCVKNSLKHNPLRIVQTLFMPFKFLVLSIHRNLNLLLSVILGIKLHDIMSVLCRIKSFLRWNWRLYSNIFPSIISNKALTEMTCCVCFPLYDR